MLRSSSPILSALVTGFTVLLLFCAYPLRLNAADSELENKQAEHLDTVLLLDSSGSMRRTDPLRLRDQGVKLFTQFLKEGDRLAIVDFSGEANVVRPLLPYNESQLAEVELAIAHIDNSGIYTDILAGVKKARNLLQTNRRENAERSIILMSDGKMDPNPEVANPVDRVNELDYSELPLLKASGIKLHTISLSEDADRKLLARMSDATSGVNWHAPSSDTIHESFAQMFLAAKKPQVLTLGSRGFPVDDGIREATFYINHDGEGGISLINPSSEEISPTDTREDAKWYRGDNFDVITITTPEPGYWTVNGLPSSDSFATVLTNLKLITDFPTANINAGDPVILQARFYESRKPVSLPELSGVVTYGYAITPTDKISAPIEKGILKDDGSHGDRKAHDGIFSAHIDIEEVGEYRLTVSARAPTFVRQQQVPFRVRPRLVALSVDKGSSGHDHGDDHSSGKEWFMVELSSEALPLKNRVLKLKARDEEHRTYVVPIKQVRGNKTLYRASTNELPEDGKYTLRVSLSGFGKRKRKVTAVSNQLEFDFKRKSGSSEVEVVHIIKHEERKDDGPSAVLPLIFLSLVNIGCGVALVNILKKAVAGISVTVEKYEPAEVTLAGLDSLKDIAGQTEIDFSDPRLSSDKISAIRQKQPLDQALQAFADSESEIDSSKSDSDASAEETAQAEDSSAEEGAEEQESTEESEGLESEAEEAEDQASQEEEATSEGDTPDQDAEQESNSEEDGASAEESDQESEEQAEEAQPEAAEEEEKS